MKEKFGYNYSIHQILTIWIMSSLLATTVAFIFLQSDFPFFIYLNLILSLIIVFKSKQIHQFGINTLPAKKLVLFAFVNLVSILMVYLLIEPWAHLYEKLLEISLEQGVDITFGWIFHYPRIIALLIVLMFAGFVTIFSEELLFRGILEGYLLQKLPPVIAIAIQSIVFSIPQSLLLFVLPIGDGLLYLIFYSIIAIGIINGIIVYKSKSIFPSVIAASFANFIMAIFFL